MEGAEGSEATGHTLVPSPQVQPHDWATSNSATREPIIPNRDRDRTISFHQPPTPSRRNDHLNLDDQPHPLPSTPIDGDESDSDALSIATTTTSDNDLDDRQYRPRFVPGHLARRLRRRKDASDDDSVQPESVSQSDSVVAPSGTIYRRTPILSGALAPFSIMLEVPGLTSKWYVRNDTSGQQVIYRPNPVLLDVGLAFSLAAAVIANLMLITRFTKLMRPRKASILAFLGFTIHDAINIAALIAFGVIHAVDDGFTYSQAYWMTLAATVCSVACTVTLLIDYLRTDNFKDSGSGLSPKQTQLIITVMILLLYLSFGSLIWSELLALSFQDALYFTCTTTLAVGFGDIIPYTTGSKIFLFFYTPLGIILFAATIYTARLTILEDLEVSYRRKTGEFRQKWKAKRAQAKAIKRERRGLKKMFARDLSDDSHPDKAEQRSSQPNQTDVDFQGSATSLRQQHSPEELVRQEMRSMEETLAQQRQDVEHRWANFRQELAAREKSEFWSRLSGSFALFLSFWLLGAMAFMFFEGWTYFQAFYFTFVLFSTIGFGDFTPKTSGGRTFFIVWSLLGVAVLTIFLSIFSDAWGTVVTGKLHKTSRLVKAKGRKFRHWILQKTHQRPTDADIRDDTMLEGGSNRANVPPALRLDIPDSAMPLREVNLPKSPSSNGGILLHGNDASPDSNGHPLSRSLSRKATLMGELRDLNGQPADAEETLVHLAQSALSLHHVSSSYINTRREAFISALRHAPEFRNLAPSSNRSPPQSPKQTTSGGPTSDSSDSAALPSSLANSPWQHVENNLPKDPSRIKALFESLHRAGGHAAVESAQEIFAFAKMEKDIRDVVRNSTTMKGWLSAQQRQIQDLKQKLKDLVPDERGRAFPPSQLDDADHRSNSPRSLRGSPELMD